MPELNEEQVAFLRAGHLAVVTTLRADGSTVSQRWKSSPSTVTTDTRASASRLRSFARPRGGVEDDVLAIRVDPDHGRVRRVGPSAPPPQGSRTA